MSTVISVICAFCLTVISAECFRVLQAASYRPQRGYFKIFFSFYYLSLAIVQVVAIFLRDLPYWNLALFAALAITWTVVKRKCPLKLTKRVWRLFVCQFVAIALLCIFVNDSYWVWLLPMISLVSWAICLPIDCLIAKHYLKLACAKLKQSGVIVIGITGSYGKTSVKDMLSAILAESVAPTGSCNTPLGIAQFINKTNLDGVKYLVLEFGARRRGDIAQLCQLFKPKYGIVTGVCSQHLATFKSFANILSTKRELVEHLPQDGFCILNQSDKYVTQFSNLTNKTTYMSYDGIDLAVSNVSFDGTTVNLVVNNNVHSLQFPQISSHVVDTFAMCLQMTLQLGQNLDTTLSKVANVAQTPHRMQLIKGANCYVLDDSYNGSIVGVQSCAATLSKFNCAKVVITQGLVECGRDKRRLNVQCGELLGNACDVAVVLGRNAKYLYEGLAQTPCKVFYAKRLDEAVKISTRYSAGGILLFQNDLPDVINI